MSNKNQSEKDEMDPRKIWQAGIGAFKRAQKKGQKFFDVLVKEGSKLEKKTRKFANENADSFKENLDKNVSNVKEHASETWSKLEKVFEDRVQRAMDKMGMPTRQDIESLNEKVEKLTEEIKNSATVRTVKDAVSKKSTTKKTARKKTATKKTKIK